MATNILVSMLKKMVVIDYSALQGVIAPALFVFYLVVTVITIINHLLWKLFKYFTSLFAKAKSDTKNEEENSFMSGSEWTNTTPFSPLPPSPPQDIFVERGLLK